MDLTEAFSLVHQIFIVEAGVSWIFRQLRGLRRIVFYHGAIILEAVCSPSSLLCIDTLKR